jgi:hypothetical protein
VSAFFPSYGAKRGSSSLSVTRTTEILRGGIRLPRSSAPRERNCFLKLLYRVDPEADHGFGFEGIILKPGSVVAPSQLRPDDRFPETPVLLEYTPGEAYGPAGRRRRDAIYILWLYNQAKDDWREMGRAVSYSWEWAVELRPLAARTLKEARSSVEIAKLTDVPAIAERIATFLDHELTPLDPCDRLRVIGVLHDQFASRLVA